MSSELVFPVYRKYSHNRTFFRILSETEFYELNIMGKYYHLKHFEAKILPDRNLIDDMLYNPHPHWDESSEEEFQERLDFCKNNLQSF